MKKLLFAIVCLMASFTFASCGGSTPADEAANCIELLKNKDYDGFVETINFKGDTAGPYNAPAKNRVAVCIVK